jgi:hypothetical protein
VFVREMAELLDRQELPVTFEAPLTAIKRTPPGAQVLAREVEVERAACSIRRRLEHDPPLEHELLKRAQEP